MNVPGLTSRIVDVVRIYADKLDLFAREVARCICRKERMILEILVRSPVFTPASMNQHCLSARSEFRDAPEPDDLVASVPPGGLLTEAQRAELRRREAEAAARPDDWVAWEDALAATRKR